MPMRNFPRPVAQFDTLPGRPERLDLAVVSGSGGTNIVAVRRQQRQRRRLGVAVRTPRPVRPGPGPLLRHLPAPPRPLRLRRPHLGGRGATGGPLRVADWQSAETGDSTCSAPAAWPTWETANSASPGPSPSSTPAKTWCPRGLPSF
ncbi:hypothetical protein PAHAL_6G275100 [Panicum hallii]|uniref:Uncharacterized protein n=1 Tax=Panicum hallii TaxID=206008 RepID=A0A2T8IHV4_9POAL|nr:hypothetical protein PAHAL_6G275100 [Panicum hallii]